MIGRATYRKETDARLREQRVSPAVVVELVEVAQEGVAQQEV